MKAFFVFLSLLATCLAAGWLGSLATMPAIPVWDRGRVKPPLTPPEALFAPVWTTLYILMAIAAWLVWRRAGFGSAALKLFFVQLLLNATWSFLFFGLRRPDYAFGEIVLLWLAILATLIAFWRIRPLAGASLLPYLAWVSFATYLNAAIWKLNPPG
jgi:translocator protein